MPLKCALTCPGLPCLQTKLLVSAIVCSDRCNPSLRIQPVNRSPFLGGGPSRHCAAPVSAMPGPGSPSSTSPQRWHHLRELPAACRERPEHHHGRLHCACRLLGLLRGCCGMMESWVGHVGHRPPDGCMCMTARLQGGAGSQGTGCVHSYCILPAACSTFQSCGRRSRAM